MLSAIIFISAISAFYLPGTAPKEYRANEPVPLLVNSLSSSRTMIPFDYYYPQWHFCRPSVLTPVSESLGSILAGDRLYSSPFNLQMAVNKTCVSLCKSVIPKSDAAFINDKINEFYLQHWIIDELPVGRNRSSHITMGFEIGNVVNKSIPILYNHHDLIIKYHENSLKNTFTVVGALVSPKSFKHSIDQPNCEQGEPLVLDDKTDSTVVFTYSVYWVPSKISWQTRWDSYLYITDENIHWFSVINSAVIVVFLSVLVGVILIRSLHADITRYNSLDQIEDLAEEFGWKLVHGDVFRAPKWANSLCVLVGNGLQVLLMCLTTVCGAALGLLNPSIRGSLPTFMIVFYCFFASVAGYVSARLFKLIGNKSWRRNVFLTSFLVPGMVFFIFSALNFFLMAAKSSGAVSAGTILSLVALWFLLSTPLCLIGSFFGLKKRKINQPVRTHQIPRQIPTQPLYLSLPVAMLLGGFLPFGAMFVEMFYIMTSVWSNRVFYLFGFLLIVSFILIITTSLVSIILTYLQLCSENYEWWWRSFLISGSTGIYVFLYAVFYYWTRLHIETGPSTILYFGYAFLSSLLLFLITGSIGFLASFMFVRKIYNSIKID